MKPLITIALVGLCLVGCITVRATLGMSETDFTRQYKTAEAVKLAQDGDVYKMNLYVQGIYKSKYFYFQEGKLVRVDDGQRRPDVIIQVQQ